MMMTLRNSVVFVLVVLATPQHAAAQSTEADIVRELKRIGQAVELLETTMRLNVEHSRVSLLLQRAELEVAGITSLESQVRNARTSRDSQVAQEEQMVTYLDDLERQTFDEADEERQAELRREREQLAVHVETVRKQARAAEQTLFELEDELAQRSGVFDALKSQIDALLGLE